MAEQALVSFVLVWKQLSEPHSVNNKHVEF